MDSLIQSIFTYSETTEKLDSLARKLDEFPKVLGRNRDAVYTALDSLDPETHSLGYLGILHFLIKDPTIPAVDLFVNLVRNFLLVCSPEQVQRCTDKLSAVACRLGKIVVTRHPIYAIQPLLRAIEIIQRNNRNLLTAVHQIVVLCCIKAKCYHLALPIVESPILEVAITQSPLEAKDNLLYHYYASVVLIAFKRRKEALECLVGALAAPSTAISAIQIACYRKYVLLSLLVYGKPMPLPRSTSPYVFRHLSKLAPEYTELADAYSAGMERLEKVVESFRVQFEKDDNLGLVQQVICGLVRRNIKNLTNTYVTLSLEDITKNSNAESPAQTEMLIRSMIEKGEIFARIDQEKGMVSFLDESQDFASQSMVADLDARIRQVMHYWRKVATMDRQVSLDPSYLTTLLKVERKASEFVETEEDGDVMMAQQLSLQEQ
eukprot:171698_1